MKHEGIPTVEELKKNFKPIRNINAQHREKLSSINKLALWITDHVGSMGFFFIIFAGQRSGLVGIRLRLLTQGLIHSRHLYSGYLFQI